MRNFDGPPPLRDRQGATSTTYASVSPRRQHPRLAIKAARVRVAVVGTQGVRQREAIQRSPTSATRRSALRTDGAPTERGVGAEAATQSPTSPEVPDDRRHVRAVLHAAGGRLGCVPRESMRRVKAPEVPTSAPACERRRWTREGWKRANLGTDGRGSLRGSYRLAHRTRPTDPGRPPGGCRGTVPPADPHDRPPGKQQRHRPKCARVEPTTPGSSQLLQARTNYAPTVSVDLEGEGPPWRATLARR